MKFGPGDKCECLQALKEYPSSSEQISKESILPTEVRNYQP